jgi:hypothetical protein
LEVPLALALVSAGSYPSAGWLDMGRLNKGWLITVLNIPISGILLTNADISG